jgi:hypothetical protein
MSQHRRWGPPVTEKVRHFVRAVARLQFLAVAATVVTVTMVIALLPRGMSDAATATATPSASASASGPAPNDDGITWNPVGAVTQTDDGKGNCKVDMDATVSGGPAVLATLQQAIDDEHVVEVNKDGVDSLAGYALPPQETNGTNGLLPVEVGASIDCSLANQTDAYIRKTGYGSLGQFSQAVLDADLHPALAGTRQYAEQHAALLSYTAFPSWLKGAVGALVGAIVYVAVSVVTVGAMVALGATTTVTGGLAAPALAAFAGCIGGAVSTAVTLFIAGASTTPAGITSSALAGCLTGGLIAQIPAGTAGVWVGNSIRTQLGRTPSAVIGNAAVQAAVEADVQMSPLTYALRRAADMLEAHRPPS